MECGRDLGVLMVNPDLIQAGFGGSGGGERDGAA